MVYKCLIIFTLILLAENTYAQDLDSLFLDRTLVHDSLTKPIQNKAPFIKNAKGITASKIDSIDQPALDKIDKEIILLNQKLDNLNRLEVSPAKYKQKADSLYLTFQEKGLSRYTLLSDTLSQAVKNRVNKLEKTINKKAFLLDSLLSDNGLDIDFSVNDKFNPALPQQSIPPINTPTLNIPETDKRDFEIPQVPTSDLLNKGPTLPGAQLPDAKIPQVDVSKTENIPGMDDLKSVQKEFTDVTDIVKDAEGYTQEMKKVMEMDVKHLEKIPEAAEKHLLETDEMNAARGELNKGDALKKEMSAFGDQAKDPEEMKEEVLHRTKQPFVDHLKGKEEKVQSGMNKMLEYQKKHRIIADTRNLPKRTDNKMKGKPWQERLVPGISFQVNREHQPWTGIDISPFIGYRLSGRFRTFIAATYRPYVNLKRLDFNPDDKAISFRWFTHVKTINGVYLHLEVQRKFEGLSLKPSHQPASDQVLNIWQNQYYVGLMRLQRINKKINAAFYVLYDLDNVGEILNPSQVEIRFGFEYRLKKKEKPEAGAEK